jgi:hypothetical protein
VGGSGRFHTGPARIGVAPRTRLPPHPSRDCGCAPGVRGGR